MNTKLIIIDHDGDNWEGIYRVYPANDESEVEEDYQKEFIYSRTDDGCYASIHDAQVAAYSVAKRIAKQIGGDWTSNE